MGALGGGSHLIFGSRNHIMLGSPGQWMMQALAGISLGKGGVAWDRIRIAPLEAATSIHSEIGGIDATVGTPRGPISVSWRASGAASIRFELNATVPVGSTSRISAPVPEGIDAAKVILTNDGKTFFCHRSFVKGAVEGFSLHSLQRTKRRLR